MRFVIEPPSLTLLTWSSWGASRRSRFTAQRESSASRLAKKTLDIVTGLSVTLQALPFRAHMQALSRGVPISTLTVTCTLLLCKSIIHQTQAVPSCLARSWLLLATVSLLLASTSNRFCFFRVYMQSISTLCLRFLVLTSPNWPRPMTRSTRSAARSTEACASVSGSGGGGSSPASGANGLLCVLCCRCRLCERQGRKGVVISNPEAAEGALSSPSSLNL